MNCHPFLKELRPILLLDDLSDHLLELGAAVVRLGGVHEGAEQVREALLVLDAEEPLAPRQVTHADADQPPAWSNKS